MFFNLKFFIDLFLYIYFSKLIRKELLRKSNKDLDVKNVFAKTMKPRFVAILSILVNICKGMYKFFHQVLIYVLRVIKATHIKMFYPFRNFRIIF